jgi:broad specificity phosphatase PhoE
MKLYIARHGETKENREKRILGSTPGVLTEEGLASAEILATKTSELGIDFVLASDLTRVVDTCKPMREHNPSLLVAFTPLLRERSFGAWEGELRKSVNWQGLWESDDEPELSLIVGAESLDAFTRRIAEVVASLNATFSETGKTVLLVAHIGVMNRFNYLANPNTFEYIDYPNADAVEFDIETILRHSQEILSDSR